MSRRDLVQRYWDAYAATLEPPPAAAEQTLARIRERIAAGERGGDAVEVHDDRARSDSVPARRRRRVAAGLVAFGKPAAVSVGLGASTLLAIKLVAVGWSQLGGGGSPLEEPRAVASGQLPARRAAAPDGDLASAPAPMPERPVARPGSLEVPPSPPPVPQPRETAAPVADRLRAEVALMERASVALERGEARTLWRLLEEHARRFPTGALAEERDAWRAVAACWLRHADAASRITDFLRAHPRSAQAAKVRTACKTIVEIE